MFDPDIRTESDAAGVGADFSRIAKRRGHILTEDNSRPDVYASILIDKPPLTIVTEEPDSDRIIWAPNQFHALLLSDHPRVIVNTWTHETHPIEVTTYDVVQTFETFLNAVEAAQQTTIGIEIRVAMESLATLWDRDTDGLPLENDDRITGDALARMLSELAKTTEPPPYEVVHAAAGWFKSRVDIFADAFAKGFGKTLGTTGALAFAGGVGVGVAKGLLPAIEHLWHLVDREL